MRVGDGAHPEEWYGVASVSRIDKMIGLFCKKPYKRDYILQKRPTILSILLTVATPYVSIRGVTCRIQMCAMTHFIYAMALCVPFVRVVVCLILNINDDNNDIT